MSHAEKRCRARDLLGPVVAGAVTVWLALQLSLANLLIDAAGIKEKGKGDWSAISTVASRIQEPMLVVVVAAVPLGILGGGILMVIGHRQAAKVLGQVIAGVVIVGIGTNLSK